MPLRPIPLVVLLPIVLLLGCRQDTHRLTAHDGFARWSSKTNHIWELSGTWRSKPALPHAVAHMDSLNYATYGYSDAHWATRAPRADSTTARWYRLHVANIHVSSLTASISHWSQPFQLLVAQPGHPPVTIFSYTRSEHEASIVYQQTPLITLPSATQLVFTLHVDATPQHAHLPFPTVRLGDAVTMRRYVATQYSLTYVPLGLAGLLLMMLVMLGARQDPRLRWLMGITAIFVVIIAASAPQSLFSAGASLMLSYTALGLLPIFVAFLLYSCFPEQFTLYPWRPQPARSLFVQLLSWGLYAVLTLSTCFMLALVMLSTHEWPLLLFATIACHSLLVVPLAYLLIQLVQQRHPLATYAALAFGCLLLGPSIDTWTNPLMPLAVPPNGLIFGGLGFTVIYAFGMLRTKMAPPQPSSPLTHSDALQASQIAIQAARLKHLAWMTNLTETLRMPLTAVVGNALSLESELGSNLARKHRTYLQTIRVSSERLLHLTNDLDDFLQVEQGNLKLTIEPVAVQKLLRDVQELMAPFRQQRFPTVSYQMPATPVYAQADAFRLRQVCLYALGSLTHSDHVHTIHITVTKGEDISRATSVAIQLAAYGAPRSADTRTASEGTLLIPMATTLLRHMGGTLKQSKSGGHEIIELMLPFNPTSPVVDDSLQEQTVVT